MTMASVFGETTGPAIAVLRSVIDLDRQPCELFDHELADQSGMPGRAAGQDGHVLDGPELRIVELRFLEKYLSGIVGYPPENRFARGVWLLEDLLEHEMLVAVLLRHDRIPEHPLRRLGDRPPEEVRELDARPA